MSSHYYQASLKSRQSDPDAFVIKSTPIYGVLNNRYLLPMASPIRVQHAWDIDSVLQTSPADDLYLFELWEDIVLSMIAGAYESDTPTSTWQDKWSKLIGGSILQKAMKGYLNGGTLSNEQKQRVLRNVGGSAVGGPEFAENTLLRLCGCLSRRRMTPDQGQATLRCIHFRLNITIRELQQMVAAYNALRSDPLGASSSLELLEFVLVEMTNRPFNEFEHPDKFEIRTEQPDNSSFELFLQEHAGSSQEVLRLEQS
jgi:hypothetical protein